MSGLALLLAAMLVQEPAAAPAAPPPLAAVAGAARYRLSASSDLLLEYLDEDSRAAFARGLRVDRERPLGLLWSQLMAGAVQIRRESGDTAETLWFNPVLDVGILARWTRGPAGWRAAAVAPVLGERLRGEAVSDLATPGWLAGSGDPAESLHSAGEASFAAAEAATWAPLFDVSEADLTAAVARLMIARGAMRRMEEAPGYGLSVAALRQALSGATETSTLPAPLAASLRTFGATARRTLRPVTAIRHPDGWTLVLQSPDAPAVSWLVGFADPAPGGTARPDAVAAVVLGDGARRP